MTPEAQRIAIAEAQKLPWKIIDKEVYVSFRRNNKRTDYLLFDPLSDLNAMHEAEKVLKSRSDDLFHIYRQELVGICGGDDKGWAAIDATAAQRAEAFLRTIGKWDDSK